MKNIAFVIGISFVLWSCTKKDRLIDLNKVGEMTEKTTVEDLKTIFKNDSLVYRFETDNFGVSNSNISNEHTYLVYQKGGKLLLAIKPKNLIDSLSEIENIQVFSSLYQTKKGVHVFSTFKELDQNHVIDKIESSFSTVALFVKDINAVFTIDKKDLGLKSFSLEKVQKSQIPDDVLLNSMTIWLEEK